MDRRYRKTIIAGNWKMNGDTAHIKDFFKQIKSVSSAAKNIKTVICTPATMIGVAQTASKGSKIGIGGQNMHFAENGAYTGEVSGKMLLEAGAEYVILGHSERREYFCETDEIVAQKLRYALEVGLKPILCVGETLLQREQGITMEIINKQLKVAFLGLANDSDAKKIVIAYEPVWAIGTGKTATPEQAGDVCAGIRKCIRELYGAKVARAMSILYGGSMNAKNAEELLSQYDIDGGLIGGASLKWADFASIIKTACETE